MKIPHPLSWQTIRALNIAVAVACIGLAIIAGPTWIGMMDSVLAGFTISSAFYITGFVRLRESFNGMADAFNKMRDLNQALIQDKVKFHVMGVMQDDDDNSDTRRLH